MLQGIEKVDLSVSYFGGRIKSELPFFPAPLNTTPLYPDAIMDLLKVASSFSIPVLVSHIVAPGPLELSKLPRLIKNEGSSLIWQIYMREDNIDQCYKQASLAESWGYKALAITVDTELNVKLGNEIPAETAIHYFVKLTPREIRKLRQSSSLPLIVKGVTHRDDAELAVESGADGIVVSNHGARTLDRIPSTLEVLPEIVKHLKSKKKTRGTEVFFDGGIRRGADILIALALGARGCLIGRPVLWALACDHEGGVASVTKLLKGELERAAILCGVSRISKVNSSTIRKADFFF